MKTFAKFHRDRGTIVDSDSQFETSSSDRTYPTGIRMLSKHTSIKVSPSPYPALFGNKWTDARA